MYHSIPVCISTTSHWLSLLAPHLVGHLTWKVKKIWENYEKLWIRKMMENASVQHGQWQGIAMNSPWLSGQKDRNQENNWKNTEKHARKHVHSWTSSNPTIPKPSITIRQGTRILIILSLTFSFRFAFLPTTLRIASDDAGNGVFWVIVANTMFENKIKQQH